MEIKIDFKKLRENVKLFLATPMYGGNCSGMYTRSVLDLAALCAKHGITLQVYYLFNESLITRARNYCCDEFIRSECTHLLFIDSDIGFNPIDVIAMLQLQIDNPEKYDIIGGPYPKKCIAWEKIKLAVDKGFADENPSELDKYVGDFVFNPKNGTNSIKLDEPAQVLEIGTGYMLIHKSTLLKFAEAYPQLSYKPDHVRTEHFDGSREIHAFFDTVIDPETKRYLSEDYMFCQYVNNIGLTTWLCPWMKTQHVGTHVYGGSLFDLAQLGTSATADPEMLKKTKKGKK